MKKTVMDKNIVFREAIGFFWHIHHDTLLGWSGDINERAEYIKTCKPAEEIKLRLKLMQPVKGALPKAVVKALDEAGKAHGEARKACNEAWKARDEAWKACDEAWKACDQALLKHKKSIEALHKKECPNCPWDGKTIFPKGDEK